MLGGFFKSSSSPSEKSLCLPGQEKMPEGNNRPNNNNEAFGNSKPKDSLSVDGGPLVSIGDSSVTSDNAGVLSGLFRRSPKPSPKCERKQDSLSVDGGPLVSIGDSSVTSDNAGVLSGLFRRSPKPSPKCERKQENVPVHPEPPARDETPPNKTDGGLFGWIFRNPFSSSAQVDSESEIKADEMPQIPPRPSEEELSSTISHQLSLLNPTERDYNQDESDDCVESAGEVHKEGQKERDGEEEDAEKNKLPKKKKVKKKKNPFMPHLTAKGKIVQKRNAVGADPAESEVQKKSLMEQLNELRLEKSHREEEEDPESLMEWWSTVKQWEQMPKDEDMTEKEEAKAFAVTAEKVQRGILVFNQLFSERAEGLWQHVIDLRAIADGLDRFNWRTKVAQITGGSTSAVGGVATITGLALAPVTMGTSLIVTAVGLGVAAAGGLTSASAGISNAVNNSLDRKKVEQIVEDYQRKMADLNKCMKFIKQGIENLRQFNLLRVKKQAYNRDFPGLDSVYEDGAMASKAVLINANEIMRVVQIANVAGSTAARAVQIASMATGVLTGLFVGMDIYFVAKDSQELRKGAKSEFATKIREVADQLHDGLVELNSIREELQSSGTNSGASINTSTTTPLSPEDNSEKTN